MIASRCTLEDWPAFSPRTHELSMGGLLVVAAGPRPYASGSKAGTSAFSQTRLRTAAVMAGLLLISAAFGSAKFGAATSFSTQHTHRHRHRAGAALHVPRTHYMSALTNRPIFHAQRFRPHSLDRNSSPMSRRDGSPFGLVELIGDRTPLAVDDNSRSASASWTPSARWYDLQNMSAHFPVCSKPDPADCDDWYAPQTTAAVQTALWATQNPADCNQARYLVLDSSWRAGFGSSLHVHLSMLALAIRCAMSLFLSFVCVKELPCLPCLFQTQTPPINHVFIQ